MAQLAPQERVAWHRQAAEAIEAVYPDEPAQAGALVYHWQMVGDEARERHYARQAGEYARRQFLNAEAIEYLSRALALTAVTDLEQQYGLLQMREQIYHLQGERAKQLQDITALRALAEQMMQGGKEDKRAEVALRLAHYAEVTGDYKTAVLSARQALEQAQASQDVMQEAASYLALGRVLIRQGNYQEAHTYLNSSLRLAQAHCLQQLEADTLRFLGVAAVDLSQYEISRDYYHKALALYRQIKDPQGESAVLNNLAIVVYSIGDLSESFAFWESAQKIYDAIGDREGRGRILTNLSSLHIFLGDYAAAKTYGHEALHICREINVRMGEFFNWNNLSLVAHFMGDLPLAEQYGLAALQIAEDIGNTLVQAYALQDIGFILTQHNSLQKAVPFLQSALEQYKKLEQANRLLETRATLAEIALRQQDLAKAEKEIAPVLEHILAEKSLEGVGRLFRIYLVCYEVTRAIDNDRAQQILSKAYHLLHERASQISDKKQRQSFLENVPTNRQIIQAYKLARDHNLWR
ncbi:MAG: tetratricopeptide repeat protein [Anaerolineales bacterium]|nr:tetratricopeptide repeat protein [Anaerolineales bacterium]